jgi:hypothetical protein
MKNCRAKRPAAVPLHPLSMEAPGNPSPGHFPNRTPAFCLWFEMGAILIALQIFTRGRKSGVRGEGVSP